MGGEPSGSKAGGRGGGPPREGKKKGNLPERLQEQRDYVVCTQDLNYNVSPLNVCLWGRYWYRAP